MILLHKGVISGRAKKCPQCEQCEQCGQQLTAHRMQASTRTSRGQTLNEWAAVKSTKLTFFYLSRCVSFTCDFL